MVWSNLDITISTGLTPTLLVTEQNNTKSGPAAFALSSYNVVNNPDGTTTVTFYVSRELLLRSFFGGDLVGGGINYAGPGTGGPEPDPKKLFPPFPPSDTYGPATGQIVFETTILQQFKNTAAANNNSSAPLSPYVNQADILSNNATIVGNILNYSNLYPNGYCAMDSSGVSVPLADGGLTKTVYAVNGNTSIPSPVQVKPGDLVTYEISYTMPHSNVDDLQLQDFLPLPIFMVPSIWSQVGSGTSTNPPATVYAADAYFVSPDSYLTPLTSNPVPVTALSNTSDNSVTFAFPTPLHDPNQDPSTINVFFTVEVGYAPVPMGCS